MQNAVVLLIAIFALPIVAQTTLSGKIGDLTINQSGNPYIITDNIVVPPGKTLTIGEGTILLFKPFTGLLVDGSLAVEGTLENPIVFTTENDTKYNPASTQAPNPFDWNGIFISPKAGMVNLSNFILEYSVYGIKSQKEEFVIVNGTFSRNGQFKVTVNDAIKNVDDNIPFSFRKEFGEKNNPAQKSAPVANRSGANTAWKTPTAIGLGIAGLAALSVGGYFFYLSSNYTSQYASATTQKQADEYFDKKNAALITAGVCTVAGVVSAACAIVIYPWQTETAKAQNVSIAPILGLRNGILITVNY